MYVYFVKKFLFEGGFSLSCIQLKTLHKRMLEHFKNLSDIKGCDDFVATLNFEVLAALTNFINFSAIFGSFGSGLSLIHI